MSYAPLDVKPLEELFDDEPPKENGFCFHRVLWLLRETEHPLCKTISIVPAFGYTAEQVYNFFDELSPLRGCTYKNFELVIGKRMLHFKERPNAEFHFDEPLMHHFV